jgi:hypothetical protein
MMSAFERDLATAQWPRSATELAGTGITRADTRSGNWRRTSRGYFAPASAPEGSAGQRILNAAPLIPVHGALAGWAAAYVHGADLLDGVDSATMRPLPVTIKLGSDLGRADTGNVHYVRDQLREAEREIRYGLPVTNPVRTALDGARWAADRVEAVVFLDQITRALGVRVDDLEAAAAASRQAGLPLVRQVLPLVEPACASPWESRLRMFYIGPARLPRPLVNMPMFDLDEQFLGIADLFDPEAGLVSEFDGQKHRLRRQHRADNLREENLEGANLVVCRVDSLDLRYPVPLAERLRERHAQGRSRDRRRDRWTLVEPDWWRRRRAS